MLRPRQCRLDPEPFAVHQRPIEAGSSGGRAARGLPAVVEAADPAVELAGFGVWVDVKVGKPDVQLFPQLQGGFGAARIMVQPHEPPVQVFGVRVELPGMFKGGDGLIVLPEAGDEFGVGDMSVQRVVVEFFADGSAHR